VTGKTQSLTVDSLVWLTISDEELKMNRIAPGQALKELLSL